MVVVRPFEQVQSWRVGYLYFDRAQVDIWAIETGVKWLDVNLFVQRNSGPLALHVAEPQGALSGGIDQADREHKLVVDKDIAGLRGKVARVGGNIVGQGIRDVW